MPNARNAHLLQLIMLQSHEGFTDNLIFWVIISGSQTNQTSQQSNRTMTNLGTRCGIDGGPGWQQIPHTPLPSIL
jgi:hypothetical protein